MRRLLVSLVLGLVVAAPSFAAGEIKANPKKEWKHEASGIRLPPSVAGLSRDRVAFFSHETLDVAGDYWSADGNDTVTLYIYRNTNGSVPVWFDRARFFILNLPDKYGAAKGMGARGFTPRGQNVASGLIETFSVTGKYRASTLVVFPMGDFYVKVRATSKVRDESSIEALAVQALAGIDWSSKIPTFAAAPIADCPDAIPARAAAKQMELSSEDRMMAGVLGGLFAAAAGEDDGKKATSIDPPATYCREAGAGSLTYGIYRPGADKERFLMAIHDGGRGISVGRNGLAELVQGEIAEKEGKSAGSPRYNVTFVELDKTSSYADFASLPTPDQAIGLIDNGRPVAVTETWGKKRNINIVTN